MYMACGTTESVKDSRGQFGVTPILHAKPRLSFFEDVTMKTCKKCLRELPRTEFYKKPHMTDGLFSSCKECESKKGKAYWSRPEVKAHRKEYKKTYTEPESSKFFRKQWRLNNKERVCAQSKKWRDKNKEKVRAYNALNQAIKMGRVIKPEQCSKCPNTGRIEGHHEDYSKPLDVEWLCRDCHAKIPSKGAVA